MTKLAFDNFDGDIFFRCCRYDGSIRRRARRSRACAAEGRSGRAGGILPSHSEEGRRPRVRRGARRCARLDERARL